MGTFQFLYNIRQNADMLLGARYYAGDLNGMDLEAGQQAEYGASIEVKF